MGLRLVGWEAIETTGVTMESLHTGQFVHRVKPLERGYCVLIKPSVFHTPPKSGRGTRVHSRRNSFKIRGMLRFCKGVSDVITGCGEFMRNVLLLTCFG